MKVVEAGFGGGCHWCTEAVFLSLKGVASVRQGWIAPQGEPEAFSEGVLLDFDPEIISLPTLIEIHLRTHSSTSMHRFRSKYRSAIYTFSAKQEAEAIEAIDELRPLFEHPVITTVLPFHRFRENSEQFIDYYRRRPDAPFCRTYIDPRLQWLKAHFATEIKVM